MTNCTLTANNTSTNGQATFLDTIMIYQSFSGDSSAGTATFSMTGGVLNSQSGHVFHVTNTSAVINLNGVTINNTDSDEILLSVCDDGRSGASNIATLNASGQKLTGDILVASDSTLTLNISDSSVFTGNISGFVKMQAAPPFVGTVNVTLDSSGKWYLTQDTYVTSFSSTASNVIAGNYSLYVNNSVLEGTSSSDNSIINSGDNVTINADKSVTIQYASGDGNDTGVGYISDDNSTNYLLQITDGTYTRSTVGNDLILTIGDNSLTLKDAATVSVNIDGQEENSSLITYTTGADRIANNKDNVTIQALSGNAGIENTGSNVSINAGAGNDTVNNYGTSVTINAGDGNDTLVYASGDGKDYIFGFENQNLLKITGAFSASYDKSKEEIYFKVATTKSAITLKDFKATSFNVNGTAYKISGNKLVK